MKTPSRRDRHRFYGKLRKAIELHALGRTMSDEHRAILNGAKATNVHGFYSGLKAFQEVRGI